MTLLLNPYRFASAGGGGGSAYADAVNADSPLGYWRLGEASGTTAADETATGDGTYTESPTLGVSGALSGDSDTAITLNGSSQYVEVPSLAAWSSAEITVEAWAKFTTSALGFIVSRDNSGSGERVLQFRVYDGQLQGIVWDTGGDIFANFITSVSGGINDDAWHHLALTVNSTASKLYVDGAEEASAAGGVVQNTTLAMRFGRSLGGTAGYFSGSLDEVAFYGTALSAARIAAHHTAGTT